MCVTTPGPINIHRDEACPVSRRYLGRLGSASPTVIRVESNAPSWPVGVVSSPPYNSPALTQ